MLLALRAEEPRERVGHRGRLVDRGPGQQDVLAAADDLGRRREHAPDALAVAPGAHVDVRRDAVDHELRAASEGRRGRALDRGEVVVPAGRAALRLDLRDAARVDARAHQEPLDDGDRVGAVGVDDDERERSRWRRGGGRRARADAHGVLVAEQELALRRALPVLGRAHLLLAVDEDARHREERDAVRAV